MKSIKELLPRAAMLLLIFTVVCGILYTGAITAIGQIVFPDKANGSIIEVNGQKYGSELLAQQYTDNTHMWGRIMKLDLSTFKDENGKMLMYAAPTNMSPASEEYRKIVAQRVAMLKESNPEMKETAIPVDLVTCSGSGLDPHISPAAAEYQIARLVKTTEMSKEKITAIVDKCTTGKFLGIFGEETVNVLKVNLMLDGILS
ncbi:MAG: K(+)-transporting ATPase subunit C [Anaerovoracaceae bacterium]